MLGISSIGYTVKTNQKRNLDKNLNFGAKSDFKSFYITPINSKLFLALRDGIVPAKKNIYIELVKTVFDYTKLVENFERNNFVLKNARGGKSYFGSAAMVAKTDDNKFMWLSTTNDPQYLKLRVGVRSGVKDLSKEGEYVEYTLSRSRISLPKRHMYDSLRTEDDVNQRVYQYMKIYLSQNPLTTAVVTPDEGKSVSYNSALVHNASLNIVGQSVNFTRNSHIEGRINKYRTEKMKTDCDVPRIQRTSGSLLGSDGFSREIKQTTYST